MVSGRCFQPAGRSLLLAPVSAPSPFLLGTQDDLPRAAGGVQCKASPRPAPGSASVDKGSQPQQNTKREATVLHSGRGKRGGISPCGLFCFLNLCLNPGTRVSFQVACWSQWIRSHPMGFGGVPSRVRLSSCQLLSEQPCLLPLPCQSHPSSPGCSLSNSGVLHPPALLSTARLSLILLH